MRALGILFVSAFLLQGCVAPNDVKVASSQTVTALKGLAEAQESFRRLYLQEIDRTRAIVEQSVVSLTVVEAVNKKAAALEEKGNLIELSREIEAAERGTRTMIGQLAELKEGPAQAAGAEAQKAPDEQQTARAAVRESVRAYLAKRREALLATAKLLPPNDPTRLELEAAAAAAETPDQRVLERMYTLLHLAAMRREAENNLVDLRGAINVLQLIHAQIDAWIQQDVTVSGTEVAKLLEKHGTTLGLVPAAGGR